MLPASIYRVSESSRPTFREQVENGVRLSDEYYLRRFPVWYDFRGNHGTVLSQAKGLSAAARLRNDTALRRLCTRQLEWVLGCNPFCQSTMYGEGYDFAPQYTAMSGDMVGSLPVGVQTHFDRDVPYWPAENCYNWKEVWVHPSSRWLWLMCDLQDAAWSDESAFELSHTIATDGLVTITARSPRRPGQLRIRGWNLEPAGLRQSVRQNDGSTVWRTRIGDRALPFVVRVASDGDPALSHDFIGNFPGSR
jgi:hypothetical protein